MDKKVIIIEDNDELAQYYKRLLGNDHFKIIVLAIDTNEGAFNLNVDKIDNTLAAYIIDINLNSKRKEERGGLEYIFRIKSNRPEVLVIAISGRPLQHEAKGAGANYFFLKEPGREAGTFNTMRDIILNYFEGQEKHQEYVSKHEKDKADSIEDVANEQNNRQRKSFNNKIKDLESQFKNKKMLRSSHQDTLDRLYEKLSGNIDPDNVPAIQVIENNIKSKEIFMQKLADELDQIEEEIERLKRMSESLL